MKTVDDLRGLELDWLATDAEGFVALFSTAGGGLVPEALQLDTDAHGHAIDALLAMAPLTRARFAPHLPADLVNTWRLVAERGVFAFDADSNGGPYHLVAAPESPVEVSQLPDAVAAVARRVRLSGARFKPGLRNEPALDVSAIRTHAAFVGAVTYVFPSRGVVDRASFFAAVRATAPLDPPIVSDRSWDALADSLWEGLHQRPEKQIVILWPNAREMAGGDPGEYRLALEVLGEVARSLGDHEATVGRPQELCILVQAD